MTFDAFDAPWWSFVFILVAGAAATDLWRVLGVAFSTRFPADSEWLVLVRAVATALVAGVIGNLVVFPSGALAETPLWLRMAAVGVGFAAYLIGGQRMALGIAAAEIALLSGIWLGPA